MAILSKSLIFPIYHLAPYPLPDYGVLGVPRWIALLENILEGENAVANIILSDYDQIISPEKNKKKSGCLWSLPRKCEIPKDT